MMTVLTGGRPRPVADDVRALMVRVTELRPGALFTVPWSDTPNKLWRVVTFDHPSQCAAVIEPASGRGKQHRISGWNVLPRET